MWCSSSSSLGSGNIFFKCSFFFLQWRRGLNIFVMVNYYYLFFKCSVWQGLNSFNQENSLSVHCIKWTHALLSKNCIFSFLICSFKISDLKNSFIRITWESKYKKTHICFTKIANLQLFEKTTTQKTCQLNNLRTIH